MRGNFTNIYFLDIIGKEYCNKYKRVNYGRSNSVQNAGHMLPIDAG